MASAAETGDGEKPHAHLSQPLLGPPQPYYAYPAASYAQPAPPLPPPTLVFVPPPCSPVFVRLRRLRPRRAPCLRRFCTWTLPLLLFLAVLAFLLYPSAPAARVADLRLDSFRVQPPVLDLGLALRLRVRNPGFVLPLRYRAVSAAASYRGHLLGSAKAWPGSGQLAARDEVYADAEVWVDAGRVLDDVIEFIEDVAAGSVPLEIVSEVVGSIKVFRFHIPVKAVYYLLHEKVPPDLFEACTITVARTCDGDFNSENWHRPHVTFDGDDCIHVPTCTSGIVGKTIPDWIAN